MSSVAQVINPLREHRRRTQPRIARGLFSTDTDARLEPDAVLVDETDASHRHPEEIRCHLRNAVKSRFRRCVEDFVSSERVQALRFVLWEHGVHRINSRLTNSSGGAASSTNRNVHDPRSALFVGCVSESWYFPPL